MRLAGTPGLDAPGAHAFGAAALNIRLARGEAVPLRDGAGRTVHAHAGRVWITEENGGRDVVLQAGESFRLAHPGLAIIEAFGDASISIG